MKKLWGKNEFINLYGKVKKHMKKFIKALWDKPERMIALIAIFGTFFIVYEIRDRGTEIRIQSKIYTTQSFSSAIELLGSDQVIIQLGAIYSLERLAGNSDEYYWPIMQVLASYCNEYDSSSTNGIKNKNSRNIQAVINVFKRRKYHYGVGEEKVKKFDLKIADLEGLNFLGINLKKANLIGANLELALLYKANLEGARFDGAILDAANLIEANFQGAVLDYAHLRYTDLEKTNLEGASFEGADLEGARNLTIEQLSKVKTLYGVKNLDHKLMEQVNEKYHHLLEELVEEELKPDE